MWNLDFQVRLDFEGQCEICTFKLDLIWRSRSTNPQNNRDLNQRVFIFWPNLVRIYHADKLRVGTHADTQTDAGSDNTRSPKLASGNKHVPVVLGGKFNYLFHFSVSYNRKWKTFHVSSSKFSATWHWGWNRTMVAAATIVSMAAADGERISIFPLVCPNKARCVLFSAPDI